MKILLHRIQPPRPTGDDSSTLEVPFVAWPGLPKHAQDAAGADIDSTLANLEVEIAGKLGSLGWLNVDTRVGHILCGPLVAGEELVSAACRLCRVLQGMQRMSETAPLDLCLIMSWADFFDPKVLGELLSDQAQETLKGRFVGFQVVNRRLPGGDTLWEDEPGRLRVLKSILRFLALEIDDQEGKAGLDLLEKFWRNATNGRDWIISLGNAQWYESPDMLPAENELRREYSLAWTEVKKAIQNPADIKTDIASVENAQQLVSRLAGMDRPTTTPLVAWVDGWSVDSVRPAHVTQEDSIGKALELDTVLGGVQKVSQQIITQHISQNLEGVRDSIETVFQESKELQEAPESGVDRICDCLKDPSIDSLQALETVSATMGELAERIGQRRDGIQKQLDETNGAESGWHYDADPRINAILGSLGDLKKATESALSLAWWLPHIIFIGLAGTYPALKWGEMLSQWIGGPAWIRPLLWWFVLVLLTCAYLYRDRSRIAAALVDVREGVELLQGDLREVARRQVEQQVLRFEVATLRRLSLRVNRWRLRLNDLIAQIEAITAGAAPVLRKKSGTEDDLGSLWNLKLRISDSDRMRWKSEAVKGAAAVVINGEPLHYPIMATQLEWEIPEDEPFRKSLERIRRQVILPQLDHKEEFLAFHPPELELKPTQVKELEEAITKALTGQIGAAAQAVIRKVRGGSGLGYGRFLFSARPQRFSSLDQTGGEAQISQ